MKRLSIDKNTIKYTFSVLLITLGLIMMLAVFGLTSPLFFKSIDLLLSGLTGSLKFFFPFILLFAGVTVLIKNKKRYILALLSIVFIYLVLLSIINLFTNIRLLSTNEVMTLFDLIERQTNKDLTLNSNIDFSKSFDFMFKLSSSKPYYAQAGGALGLLFSLPLHNLIGNTFSSILLCLIFLLLWYVFIKFILLNLFFNKKNIYRVGPYEFTNKHEYEQYLVYLENWRRQNDPNYSMSTNTNSQTIPVYTAQEVDDNIDDIKPDTDFSDQSLVYLPDEKPIITTNPIPKGKKKVKKAEQVKSIDYDKPIVDDNSDFSDSDNNENRISNADINLQMQKINDKKIRERNEKSKSILENDTFELENNLKNQQNNQNSFEQKSLFSTRETGRRFDNTTPNLDLLENNNIKTDSKEIEQKPYVYPKAALLEDPIHLSEDYGAEDKNNSKIIEETLESFKIPSKVVRICRGPAVTRFEVDIASGIKVNKVVNSAENLALKLSSQNGVRIEAPVPGTTYIGIEIPNKRISPISFKEVLFSKEMQETKEPLAIALGKDIAGKPIICNLEKMPHLLIAGATGSGKSVCINSIIMSLIYRCSPDECRLILIDPKFVELSRYNVLPHLLVPVVNETSKASGALSWAVAEMNDRYNLFKNYRVNNIKEYNKLVSETGKKLPRIVIIIDEMADLMVSTSKKEVEYNVNRLAALARAAGLHLVVATQRPSVNVITGVIKSNLPSRIAFAASSAVDSRTILDRQGAENLLGNGDMLYLPIGSMNPIRVQGCFVKNNEVNTVIEFIRKNNSTNYDNSATVAVEMAYSAEIQEPIDNNKPTDNTDNTVDALLEEAIDMVLSDGQASISMLQRRLSIGYARAGRLVDTMAKYGIVSQASGSKAREVLMTREQFEQIRYKIL